MNFDFKCWNSGLLYMNVYIWVGNKYLFNDLSFELKCYFVCDLYSVYYYERCLW